MILSSLELIIIISGTERPDEEEEGGQTPGGGGDPRSVGGHGADDRTGSPGPSGNVSLPVSAGKVHHGTYELKE